MSSLLSPLPEMTAQTFAAAAGQPFTIDIQGEPPVRLRLVDVTEATFPGTEQFSLVFVGPGDRPFGQGIRAVRHDTLGAFALFFVPVGVDGPTRLYQAVFNRLAQTG